MGAGTEGCGFPWSLTGCKLTLELCHSSKIYLILTRLLFPRTSPQIFSAVFPATLTVCFLCPVLGPKHKCLNFVSNASLKVVVDPQESI